MKALLLAAGVGSRLAPLTDSWPKCLMPVQGRPLMEYWLRSLEIAGVTEVLVNLHHHHETVREFLEGVESGLIIKSVFEPELLNTAGTIRANSRFLGNEPALIIHADNWCHCDLSGFINLHMARRSPQQLITMMTFLAEEPEKAGIVELDEHGSVTAFHEKQQNPPGKVANAAIYILEPEVVGAIQRDITMHDFSLDVIPRYIGQIGTWHNSEIHRDIGTAENLIKAQYDPIPDFPTILSAPWRAMFRRSDIFHKVAALTR